MNSVINCVKCGNPLQKVLFGIAHGFAGGIKEEDAEGCVINWLVCINPNCTDGSKNINQGGMEVDI